MVIAAGGTAFHPRLAAIAGLCGDQHHDAKGGGVRGDASVGRAMGDLDRLVPAGIIEQWVFHLRRQRSRAQDALWLIEQGYTIHDGRGGVPTGDATVRFRREHETVIDEVNALLALYDRINLGAEADAEVGLV
jgi:hypothetical protein